MHVGLIMDGNGRWAERQGKPRAYGHSQGLVSLKSAIRYAAKQESISQLTVFALSRDNLKRSEFEISAIISLLHSVLNSEVNCFLELGVAVKFVGDLSFFSEDLQSMMLNFKNETKIGTSLILNVAINYSGKQDIIQTIKGNLTCDESELDAAFEISPLDLLIRTSGEQRLSDFCIWQAAYAELYFTKCLWPDFTEQEFSQAVKWFKSRNRRFGEVLE